ncbi:MAG TPA: neuraminidase-like domain-containing protein, partial [Ktedonobacteraceae bacterium]|nr:neuraminidase-like domain-containing protein [Ktedonobacteraceae bacterium]
DGIALLKKAFDLSTTMGVNISFHDQILPIATASAKDNWATYTSAASATIAVVKARYNDDDWANISDDMTRSLDETKRSALTGLVLWKLGLKNLRTLSEYLLIDVEMTGCASISIIKQAILSMQMYLQRCRMNLEPGVTTVNIPDIWWEWMMNYRIWQANRKVFLYPENYIDPSLRKNKSDLFQELESELLQSNITAESVEAAYQNYFDKFAELAKLRITESYRCFVTQPDSPDPVDTLFLFGRTATLSKK